VHLDLAHTGQARFVVIVHFNDHVASAWVCSASWLVTSEFTHKTVLFMKECAQNSQKHTGPSRAVFSLKMHLRAHDHVVHFGRELVCRQPPLAEMCLKRSCRINGVLTALGVLLSCRSPCACSRTRPNENILWFAMQNTFFDQFANAHMSTSVVFTTVSYIGHCGEAHKIPALGYTGP
jgi:hypothetical protein